MKNNKLSYTAINTDYFPGSCDDCFGSEKLEYKNVYGKLMNRQKDCVTVKTPISLQPCISLKKGSLNFGGIEWRGPGNALVSALK